MNSELDEKILRERQNIARLAKIEAIQAQLYNEKSALEQKSAELKVILEKENMDVKRLEDKGLFFLFYSVLGNRDERIEKERREALAAKLKYDQAVKDLEDISYRLEKLSSERRDIGNCQAEYDRLFELKKNALLLEKGETAQKILEVMEKIGFLKSRVNEVNEALNVGSQVIHSLDAAMGCLDSAAGWGTFDLLGGGFIADMAKHSHIDEARSQMEETQRLLRSFRTELADVEIIADLGIETGGFATFADFFFDGLIADWYMQSRIKQSLDSTYSVRAQVSSVIGRLENMNDADKSELDILESALSDLVVNSRGV